MIWISATLLFGGCNGNAGTIEPSPSVRLTPAFAGATFAMPVDLRQAPGENGWWYVVEQAGTIRVVPTEGEPALFADIRAGVDSRPTEAGLLAIAFHPAFAENRQVYLSYTAPGAGEAALVSRISRFTASPDGRQLDPASEEILLTLDQPFGNHNGGNIVFGPDGYLYIGFGDGGSGGDPLGNGQNPETLLGTILRIDVDNTAPPRAYAIPADNPFADAEEGTPEVFAYGLRNPWRFSFDRQTNILWAADVGQNDWEEVNIITAGGNFGWNLREGAHCYPPNVTDCPTEGLIDPVAEYPTGGDCSVTGGFVYRGDGIPALQGTYIFGDFCSGRIWGLPLDLQGLPAGPQRLLLDSPARISSFGEGNDGEIYVVDRDQGRIYRIDGAAGN